MVYLKKLIMNIKKGFPVLNDKIVDTDMQLEKNVYNMYK